MFLSKRDERAKYMKYSKCNYSFQGGEAVALPPCAIVSVR